MARSTDSAETAVAAQSPPVLTVARLNRLVRDSLEERFQGVWVSGEISDLARPASGHLYFSLKDDRATVRCAMFRSRQQKLEFKPEDGVKVKVLGGVSLYEPRGSYQLIVSVMKPDGVGELHILFEKLKKKLHAEGLFDAGRKKAIPDFPQTIGVVTSNSGAAIRDVLSVLRRRFPMGQVIVYPTLVQGAHAAGAIVDMLETAGRRAECDVLLLTRGGGSLEDLWSFNEEIVARAIHACPLPVISGIGHEVDTTISDLAADQRAATPSAAAELVSPDQKTLRRLVRQARERLLDNARTRLDTHRRHYRQIQRRIRDPEKALNTLRQRVDETNGRLRRIGPRPVEEGRREWERLFHRLRLRYPHVTGSYARVADQHGRLRRAAGNVLHRYRNALKHQEHTLRTVSPYAVLNRGYAIVRKQDGTVVRSRRQLSPDEMLNVLLAEGRVQVVTCDISPGSGDGGDTDRQTRD